MYVLFAILSWAGLLALVLILPELTASPTAGEDLTRWTVRLALLYYAAALTLMMTLRPRDWPAQTGRGRLARCCWSLAWAAFLIHLGMAFHHYHHWSHNDAVEHTRVVSGVGEGVYFSYLFALLWSADVAVWWLRPLWYAQRSAWIDRALHGLMLFIVFNATIVYETGFIRWAGVALFVFLFTFRARVVLRERVLSPATRRERET